MAKQEGKPLLPLGMKQSDSNSSVHTIVYSLDSERRQKALPFGLPSGAVAGAAYCTASLSMVRALVPLVVYLVHIAHYRIDEK